MFTFTKMNICIFLSMYLSNRVIRNHLYLGMSFTKRTWCIHHRIFPTKVPNFEGHCFSFDRGVEASSTQKSQGDGENLASRRSIFGLMLGLSAFGLSNSKANGDGLPPVEKPRLCDDACEKELENVW